MVDILARYSYSSLESFNSCPQQFKFAYIDKVKKEKGDNAPSIMGRIVHRALETLYKHGRDGVLYPKDEIRKFYRDEWNKLKIEYIKVDSNFYTIDDYIRIGDEILSNYYDKFQPFNQSTLLGTEMNIYYQIPNTDYRFLCRIDRLSKRDDGTIEIIDYKTGTYLSKPTDRSYFFQMGLYQLAVQSNYPKYTDIELIQYSLRHGEEVRYKMSPEELDVLVEEFKNAIRETLYATEMNSFPTQEGNHCLFCDFFHICPAKIHKLMLEEEASTEDGVYSAERLKEIADEYIEKIDQQKVIKEEIESLKAQLTAIVKQYQISVVEGESGRVNVKLTHDKKFVTKTDDKKLFNELSFLCREAGLDEFFKLDGLSLMRDGVNKEHLPRELMSKLEKYILEKESSRITIKRSLDNDDKNDIT